MDKKEINILTMFLFIALLIWATIVNISAIKLKSEIKHIKELHTAEYDILFELYEEELWYIQEQYEHDLELLELEMHYTIKLHEIEHKYINNEREYDYINYLKIIDLLIEYYHIDDETPFMEWLEANYKYLYDWGVGK